MLPGALLHAHLADASLTPRSLHDRRTFFDRARQRLLHIHVLAGVQRVDGDGRVPVVGRGDQRHIHFFHLQQLAVVAERRRVHGLLLGHVDLLSIDVGHGHHPEDGLFINRLITWRPRSPTPITPNWIASFAPRTRE